MARILLVDDDPVMHKIAESALPQHIVEGAYSGEEALRLYAAKPFDAVVCDLKLPGMQGFEVIDHIRRQNPDARVLIITGDHPEARVIASLRLNIIDFLAKPFDFEQFAAAVDNVLASGEGIEVLSATSQWVELRVPASFCVAARLGMFVQQMQLDIDRDTREMISIAFRELLNNAIEHGCEGDSRRRIRICYIRTQRVILYRISDPGRGFVRAQLPHAAISNPKDDPIRHTRVREEVGMRPGGFGILWSEQLADELIYNETGNEVVFVRYTDRPLQPVGYADSQSSNSAGDET